MPRPHVASIGLPGLGQGGLVVWGQAPDCMVRAKLDWSYGDQQRISCSGSGWTGHIGTSAGLPGLGQGGLVVCGDQHRIAWCGSG